MRREDPSLVEALGSLPRTRKPGRDLWPGIAAGLDDRVESAPGSGNHLFRRYAGLAAMLAVAVLIGYELGINRTAGPDGTRQDAWQGEYPARALNNAQLSDEYLGAMREIVALSSQQRINWMPDESTEGVETGMQEMLQTETLLRDAMKMEPGNEYLGTLLTKLQAQQLNLIQEIPHIERQIRRLL